LLDCFLNYQYYIYNIYDTNGTNSKHNKDFLLSFGFSGAKNPYFTVPIHPENSIENFVKVERTSQMGTYQPQNILDFPAQEAPKKLGKGQRMRNVDGIKYFNAKQIKLIRRQARDQAEIDERKGKVTGIREWMAIDLLTSTGLRVSEASNLRCGDLKLGYGESKVFVKEGQRKNIGKCRCQRIPEKAPETVLELEKRQGRTDRGR
jgi:hypothetical protein